MDRESSLSRLSIRLTHLADSPDPDLTRLLKKLRHAIKDGDEGAELDRLSDQLARHMITLEQNPPADLHVPLTSHYATDFAESIKSLDVDQSYRNKLDYLASQMAKAPQVDQQLQYLRDVFRLLRTATSHKTQEKSSYGGVLNWFDKKDGKKGDKTNEQLNGFLLKATDLLNQIISHMDVLNGSPSETKWLKEQLSESETVESLGSVLDEVIDLLSELTGKVNEERLTTQSFLGNLHTKLQSVEEVIFSVITDGDKSFERAATLEKAVNDDVQVIGKAVDENDLDVLKKTVESGLVNLSAKVASYLETERKQHQESKQKIKGLTRQVRSMESETTKLRSEVRNSLDLVMKDPLTGVYNRGGYEARVIEEFSRKQRVNAPLSLVFVDCNKFKQINDTFGHNAGDTVLVKVAETLKVRARTSDVVARYGGDEFVVLLTDTDITGAEVFAKDACDKIRKAGFNNNGKPLDVSISCGVTEVRDDDTPVTALHRADQAMYKAKNETEDKVFVV